MGLDEAITKYHASDKERAEQLFREALTTSLTDEDAGWCELYLGAIAREKGDPGAALAFLATALKRSLPLGLRISAHYHAGLVCYANLDSRRAVEYLAEAARLAQESPEASNPDEYAHCLFLLGWSHYELAAYDEALQSLAAAKRLRLEGAEKDHERQSQIDLLIGWALYRLGRYAEARRSLEEALSAGTRLDPANRAIGEYYLALCLFEDGRPQEAIALLRGVLRHGRDDLELPLRYRASAFWSLGRMYYSLDNYGDALAWLQKAHGLADEQLLKAEAIGSFAADCLVEEGQAQEALRFAKEAYEANPHDAIRVIIFAKVLAVLGEYPQAIALLGAVRAEGLSLWERERLFAHQCWLFATVGDRPRYEACYTALKVLNPQSRYLVDPSRTRWLPPPETLR